MKHQKAYLGDKKMSDKSEDSLLKKYVRIFLVVAAYW